MQQNIHNMFGNSSPIHYLPNPWISRKATNNLFNYPTKKQKHILWEQYPQPKVAEVNTNNSPNSHKLSTLAHTAAVDTIRHHVIIIAATHTQCCASMATVGELTVVKWLPLQSNKTITFYLNSWPVTEIGTSSIYDVKLPSAVMLYRSYNRGRTTPVCQQGRMIC